jgi:hypothetical protein
VDGARPGRTSATRKGLFPVARRRASFRPTGQVSGRTRRDRQVPGGRGVRARRGPVGCLGSGRRVRQLGRPDTLLDALCDLDRRHLHLIVNNVGSDFTGVGRLLAEGRIRRLTASFPVLPEFYDEYFAGRVEFELVPQGTLAERLRAGGAGIAAFYTPSGAGTMLADGTFPLRYAADAPGPGRRAAAGSG